MQFTGRTFRGWLNRQLIRKDLVVGTISAFLALIATHIGLYYFFTDYWLVLEDYVYLLYVLFGISLLVVLWAPTRFVIPYELVASGIHTYLACAIGGLESNLYIVFVMLAVRCYLLFSDRKKLLVFGYWYYSSLLLVGFFTDFWVPGWTAPELGPLIPKFLGKVVMVAQAPLFLFMLRAAIRRAESGRDRYHQLREESARLESELGRHAKLQRLIFDQSSDAQFLIEEKNFRIIDCNDQAIRLFKANQKADLVGLRAIALGQNYWSREVLTDLLFKLRVKKEYQAELEYRTLRGGRFWGLLAIRRFHWESQSFLVARIADRTQAKSYQAALERKNSELERYIASNLQLENFAYMASHDLKEPLRSIIAFAQLLDRRYSAQLDKPGQEFIQHIVSAGRNLDNLIRSLLEYSKVQSEQLELQQVDLPILISEILRDLGPLIREKGASIRVDPNMPTELWGDPSRLRQLWQNLITNSLKFHREGVSPIIELGHRKIDEEHHFCVTDNGIGIEEENQDKVFFLFKKLHGKDQFEGSGIGLAMCKRIVQQHHGRIWIEKPEDNLGTRFCFVLEGKDRRPAPLVTMAKEEDG